MHKATATQILREDVRLDRVDMATSCKNDGRVDADSMQSSFRRQAHYEIAFLGAVPTFDPTQVSAGPGLSLKHQRQWSFRMPEKPSHPFRTLAPETRLVKREKPHYPR
jgi:hypothetical protein